MSAATPSRRLTSTPGCDWPKRASSPGTSTSAAGTSGPVRRRPRRTPRRGRPAVGGACDGVRAERITVSERGERAVEFESDAGAGEPAVVEVAIVPPADAADDVLMTRTAELVNRVYAEAEKGLWRD